MSLRTDDANGDLSKLDLEKSSDLINPEMRILITHFVSPQLFWYIELNELKEKANTVRQIERKLVNHCHESNQLKDYDQNQYVIVEFLPCYPKKLMRGVICQSIDEKYLVWALDYGFTINCLGMNLWLLPKELQQKCINVKEGSLASVIPFNGSNWSNEGIRIFDRKLEESPQLFFKPLFKNLEPNVGQLFWMSSNPTECNQQVNAESYLVKNEYACLDVKASMLMSLKLSSSPVDTFNMDLSEVNKTGTEPRLRVRNIIRLLSDQDYIYNLNSKKAINDCNHQFDTLLGRRSFTIPKSAMQMSKVTRGSSSSYGNFPSAKVSALSISSENPLKIIKFLDKDNSSHENGTKSLQNLLEEAKATQHLSLGQEKFDLTSNNRIEIFLNKKSSPEHFSRIEHTKKRSQSRANIPLAHSDLPVIPLESMQSSPFCQNIQNAMKSLNFHSSILPTQHFAWPHLMRQRGNSLLLIDGPNTGRTWCYLPALCSLVISGMQGFNGNRGRLGPVAIILTDMANVSKLANSCATLLQAYNTPFRKVINTCSYSQRELCTMLLDSCGILIATLEKLKSLLEIHCNNGLTIFDPNYLKLFVCDDYDRLHLLNPKQLNEIIHKIRGTSNYRFGLVLVSQQWHAKIFSKLIKNFTKSPLILFGDFLQAAMYGGLKLETVIRRTNEKLPELFKYLDGQKSKRIMIYCKNQQELEILTTELTKKDYQCIGLSEAEYQQPHQLLIVTDELSNECCILTKRNVEVLIHYSMPESWRKFVYRFHSMMDIIPNLLVPTANPLKIVTYLILDQSNHLELLRLLQFLNAHGIEMDKCIRQAVVNYQEEIEMMRPFCPYLLSSGECKEKQRCNKRHHFVRSDVQHAQNPMQQIGTIVRCNVCKVYDPVHIAVWPIEYKPAGSSIWLNAPNSISRLSMELAMSMAIKCQPLQNFKIGDICVLQQEGQFKRVRIVNLHDGRQVTVQLMDLGTELLKAKSTELFECEDKFQTLPPLAMDVRLSRVEPAGGESLEWSPEAIKWVSTSLRSLNDQQFIQIIIDFAMINVVYVNEIAMVEKCRTMKTTVYKLILGKELILRGYGQLGEKINKQLKKLAEQERNTNTNGLIEKNCKIEEPMEMHVQLKKSTTNDPTISETRTDSKLGNINRLSLLMDAINEFLRKKELSKEFKSDQNELNQEIVDDPIGVEPSVLDSSSQLINFLISELNDKNSSSNNKKSALQFIQNILDDEESPKLNIKKSKDKLDKINNMASASSVSVNEMTHPSTDQTADALKCALITDGAVCPNVKWRQSFYHIDITFEQQVPQYELVHRGNMILYSVTATVPPQRCVLNLLAEVQIVSEQQHGYNLCVKLAKLNHINYWPTLLNSLYAQQHFRWLSYDTDRAKSPPPSMCHDLWQRYMKKCYFTYNTSDNNQASDSLTSDDQSDKDVERCQSLITDFYEDN